MTRGLRFCMAGLASALLVACSVPVLAADDGKEDPLVQLAVVRAHVEVTLRDLQPLFRPHNAYQEAHPQLERLKTRIDQVYNRVREQEEAKGDARQEAFLKDCQAQLEAAETVWETLQAESIAKLDAKAEANEADLNSLKEVMQNLWNLEPQWKAAGLDLTALQTAYAAVDKRLRELKASAELLHAEMRKNVALLEGNLKEAEKYAGIKDKK